MTSDSHRCPFPGSTGRGIRIAVIDSGVNARHPHIRRVAGGVSIGPNGQIEDCSYTDLLGHGTAVMAAVQEKAPAADFFAVKLFHESLTTKADLVLRALEWSVEQRMDVVNLSLGTRNPAHALRFAEIAAAAAGAGVILVAARESGGDPCYPGCLPNVVSVGLNSECPRNRYWSAESGGHSVFYASGYPRSLPGIPPERNLQGISFAVANMTGFVACACEQYAWDSGLPRTAEAIRQSLIGEAIPQAGAAAE
jgi:hypothetical protein